ncbi:MAG: RdgB/HAM1 family non-canonical purine NTP pyrophosphatase [Lachnospiraceae bacterium]|nr:RdgB/HAM1 family non-canonical purine NTP pyrophosphatase [Lachnospiraceae bacterium]
MGKRIIFATKNEGKMVEIAVIMRDIGMPVVSMEAAGLAMDIVEDGVTFEENALLKARAVAEIFPDDIVLADDSGLEIDYLNGEPGVYSARFAGRDTPYEEKNRILLEKLEGVADARRSARFVCVIAAIFPDAGETVIRETIEGQIAHEISGIHGFGYDPIFYVPKYHCTTAEMSPALKNELSHRGKALRTINKMIEEKIGK